MMGALRKGQTLVPKTTPPGAAQEREAAAQADFKLIRVVEPVGGDVAYRLEGPGRYNYGQTRVARAGELLEMSAGTGPESPWSPAVRRRERAKIAALCEQTFGPNWKNMAIVSPLGTFRLADAPDEAGPDPDPPPTGPYGLFQMLPPRPPRLPATPAQQVAWGLAYVKGRYGSSS
jgi:hypothetical protein